MGKIRDKAYSLNCGLCKATGDQPCTHRITGLPLKNFHKCRTWEAKEDVVNAQVKQIERLSTEECKASKKFLENHADQPVVVSGMWLGDFIGKPVEVGFTGCQFAIEKMLGDTPSDIDFVWLPYCTAMVLKETSDLIPSA